MATVDGLAVAIVFAFVAPVLLLLGLVAYGYLAGHAGIEFEWNLWGGFADPVGRFATVLVFCIAVALRYRKRRRPPPLDR